MRLSEQLQYWANHSNISEQGKKDHAAMAKDAEALEARLSKMESYAVHNEACAIEGKGTDEIDAEFCTCGFVEALAGES